MWAVSVGGSAVALILLSAMDGIDSVDGREGSALGESPDTKVQNC